MASRRPFRISRWLAAFAGLVAIVAIFRFWLHVNPTTAALSLLLYVLLLAAKSSLRSVVSVALAAAAFFNFFFLPPVDNFAVTDSKNLFALVVFVATAVIASRLASRARDEAEQARDRQRELAVLFTVSRNLLQGDDADALLAALPERIRDAAGAASAVLQRVDQLSPLLPGHGRIPVRTSGQVQGILDLGGVNLSAETLEAIGDVISIALERERALEDAARSEAAEQSERLRALILDSITHELRTPLTSIKGAASTLLSIQGLDEAARRELITIVDEESDRLNRLVGQAVEMAQIEANELHITLAPLRLSALITLAQENAAHVFQTHPVTTDLEGMPTVLADCELIAKVLCNLLENAAKYSPAGSPILVRGERRGDTVLTSVIDRGPGIHAQEQSLVFDRLYRSHSQRGKTPGTGMGLAISRAIVQAHGGTLTVSSQPGEGATFTFSLPIHQL